DAIAQVDADQGVVHQTQAFAQWGADVVDEFDRRRAGAAFGAVDDDEVGGDARFQHGLGDGEPFPGVAHAQFEPHRLAFGQLAQALHEVQQADGRIKRAVAGRRVAVLSGRDTPRFGNFGSDLGARQDAAVAGLGPLRQFYLDHFYLGCTGVAYEGLLGECAVFVAASEVTRADVPHQRAAGLAVIPADAAFAGVVREAAQAGAFVQRHDRLGRKGGEAHRRNVECRHRVRLGAFGSAHHDPEIRIGDARRHQRMVDPFVALAIDILACAERALVDFLLGALVDDRALRARERRGLRIVFQEVLADLRPDELEKKAQIAQDRVVAAYRVPRLDQVIDAQQGQQRQRYRSPEPVGRN